MIPILIVCHNNYRYVENTVRQLLHINEEFYDWIYIMDNLSTCEKTKLYLETCGCHVIFKNTNVGPWVSPYVNSDVYDEMPNEFILTDPDLQFNKNLPKNFIEILYTLSNKHKCYKIGFALDIKDKDSMLFKDIYESEQVFWSRKIQDDTYDLYYAEIDTVFCLVNKLYAWERPESEILYLRPWTEIENCIRIAGEFTANHIPWYKENSIYSAYELFITCTNSDISTIKRHHLSYIDQTYFKVQKREEVFLINKDDPYQEFWINEFPEWNETIFDILDTFLSSSKIFIDIGGYLGLTTLYGSRKSKQVIAFNEDNRNWHNNTINKNIISFPDYDFSKIQHVDTISVVKIDLKGGEEAIIEELMAFHKDKNVPLCIVFDYTHWKDKNLDRFSFFTEEQKNKIKENPVTVIVWPSHPKQREHQSVGEYW